MIEVVTMPAKPEQPGPDQIARVLAAIDPGLRLVRAEPLAGGISAQVTKITAERPGGPAQELVLRQYGAANLRADPQIAVHEYQLLTLLLSAGLPVPRPLLADESAALIPSPFLVSEFIDGSAVTDPDQVGQASAFAGQLAAGLARLHRAGLARADAPYLPEVRELTERRLGHPPVSPDENLGETAVRAALSRVWPPPRSNRPVVLHGDYWPGNTLWRDGQLAAIIDWEDAEVGDPLADLANARMELWMAFGPAVAAEFTRRYLALMPELDRAALPVWDLSAALRHAGRMSEWGLSAAGLARLRAGHEQFRTAALAAVAGPGPMESGPGSPDGRR